MIFCVSCPQRREPGLVSPETGFTDACERPCERWEPNPGTLEEQPVLLTTESSCQPLKWLIVLAEQVLSGSYLLYK